MIMKNTVLRISILFFSFLTLQKTQAQSLLWQVEKNGVRSYLYGTIHIKDKRVFYFNDSLFSKINQVDQLALEIDLNPSNLFKAQKLLMTSEEKPLRSYFKSEKDYKKFLNEAGELSGLGETVVEKLKPFATMSMLMQTQLKAERKESVDEFLYKYGQEHKIPTIGLETLEEQIAITDGIPGKDYLRFIDEYEESEEQFEALLKAYINEDIEELYAEFKKELYSDYWENEFINKRNQIMFDRAHKIMAQNTSLFIAVGAGHLGGPNGLITHFKNAGYTVSPVVAGKTYVNDLLPSEEEKEGWKNYNWDLGFTIDMPGEIETESNSIPFVLGETLEMVTHKSQPTDNENLIYVISYLEIPADYESTEADLEVFTEPMINAMVEQLKGKIQKESTVKSEIYSGKELEVAMYEGTAIDYIRTLHTAKQIFILQTITMADNKGNESIYKFFNSLNIE